MESIIQIQNITKSELFNQLELIVDSKLDSLAKQDLNLKLSIQETAKELSVSEITIHNYIKKGILPALKIGRRVFIKRVDLDEALKEVKSLKYKV